MASDASRDLRRLAKRYRITFKPPISSDQWPSAHRNTFANIQKIGDQKFDSFCANVDIHSSEQPWREQTKHRAEWLAKRATRLFSQQRNEAGWRFGLENDVLRRFSVEVACPKCRARIWRSEIEACINESDEMAAKLEERRKMRKSCHCPPGDRPHDYYELGTNPLFDDRSQEAIIHDSLLRSELPKQEPDRVYGLKATTNFENLLQAPTANTLGFGNGPFVGDMVKSSPFKDSVDPLLFPFLILEAKSETSSNGFDDIQVQTAFPIWSLLKLQEGLHAKVRNIGPETGPLVWFLANRGDAWRVYGCCATEEPRGYDIIHLWNGCVMFKDDALQLLLIVDYIFDWARDIFRPSILRQLKSLATGRPYDEVSVILDSDIGSMGNISEWIRGTHSIFDDFDIHSDLADTPITLDHQSMLNLQIPNTKLGTIRSASLAESRVLGFYIEEHNVRVLLQMAGGPYQTTENSTRAARILLNLLTGQHVLGERDDLLLLAGEDLALIEEIWTGEVRSARTAPASSRNGSFYVLITLATFFNRSWDIVREMTYLAVSKSAYDILLGYAAFKVRHRGIESMAQKGRLCNIQVLTESINCFLSSSPSQLLFAAVACVNLTLYSLPERKRADYTPPTEMLGFGYIRRRELRDLVTKFHDLGRTRTKQRTYKGPKKQPQRLMGSQSRTYFKPEELTFLRYSDRKDLISRDKYHDKASCNRCRRLGHSVEKEHHFPRKNRTIFSFYGMVLVDAPNLSKHPAVRPYRANRHDICLFAVDIPSEINDVGALPLIVEDLLWGGNCYHTIRHPLPAKVGTESVDFRNTLWNLPLPRRPPTDMQRYDISDWVAELQGLSAPTQRRSSDQEDCWDNLQALLHLLNEGMTLEIATWTVNLEKWKRKGLYGLYKAKVKEDKSGLSDERRARTPEDEKKPYVSLRLN